MAVNLEENTPRKRRPPGPGKPFTKDDPRINRKGRPVIPKTSKQLMRLIDSILAEPAPKRKDRNKLQHAIDRLLATSSGTMYIIDKRYGKTPIDINFMLMALFSKLDYNSLPAETLEKLTRGDASELLAKMLGAGEAADLADDAVEGEVQDVEAPKSIESKEEE